MPFILFSPTSLLILCLAASQRALAIPQSATSGSCSQWSGFGGVQHMFTFGDSYSSTGFNPSADVQPTSADPLTNYWTSCGGPNWVSFLTTTYQQSPFLQYNLAVAGATVDSAITPQANSDIKSFRQQVEELFIPIYGSQSSPAPWTGANSLFAIWIGINDVIGSQGASVNDKIDQTMVEYGVLAETLYAAGARNFLFLDVPAIDLSPMVNTANPEAISEYTQSISYYNQKLAAMADQFTQNHCDVTAFEFDAYTLTTQAVDDDSEFPQTQGLKDVKTFCPNYSTVVLNPDANDPACPLPLKEYMWFDKLHPTGSIHELWAQKIAELLST